MSKLYKTIEELCEKENLNITQMCKAVGISRAALSDLKAGRTQILSTSTLEKIGSYFNVSLEYLLSGEQSENNIKVYDEDDNIVVIDDETRDIIDTLRTNPEMKILFSVSKKATKEDILKAVKIIEALKGDE